MKTKLALLLVFAALTASAIISYAEDLTTLDGKAFTNITEITKYPAQMVFTYSGKRTSISISNLPADFRTKHGITIITNAPTNSVEEFRMVGKVKYDVSKPPFLDVTIPAGSTLWNANRIQFNGEIKPISVSLAFPHAITASQWVTVSIENFPYDSKYFTKTYPTSPYTGLPDPRNGEIILLRAPLHLRLFPLSHPITNWTALGEMRITPALPHFDYGLPCTNQVSDVK